ncbi:MAG: hypothetical protein ACREOI_04730 [bacterium]
MLSILLDRRLMRVAYCALLAAVLIGNPVWSQQKSSTQAAANTTGRDSLTVQALRAQPGKPSLYELRFITTDTLARDAEIVVTFSRAFDLSQLEIAGSSQINGGFKLERKSQEVHLRRTGLGERIPPGRKVSLQLGLVVNPPDFSASHQVTVQLPAATPLAKTVAINKDVKFITQ